jgi:hypothetical protein
MTGAGTIDSLLLPRILDQARVHSTVSLAPEKSRGKGPAMKEIKAHRFISSGCRMAQTAKNSLDSQ